MNQPESSSSKMDSKLKAGGMLGHEQKQRKVVVHPTPRPSTTTVKTSAARFISHEPVRAAVLQADEKLSPRQSNTASLKWNESLSNYDAPKIALDAAGFQQQTGRLKSHTKETSRTSRMSPLLFDQSSVTPVNNVRPFVESLDVQTDAEARKLSGSASIPSRMHCDPLAFLSTNAVDCLPQAERMMDISNSSSKTTQELNAVDQVARLREELEVLTKVNSDLKKLLVASIGDDLHYKVDALVRTKVQLANEIGDYTRKLVEDYEDLDKLSIQADLWHSKYQASRVLVEQLTSECSRLGGLNDEAQTALQYTIQERHELNELLILARRNLLEIVGSCKPSAVKNFSTKCLHALDLAIDVKRLTDSACRSIVGHLPLRTQESDTRQSFTPAELFTHQVLSSAFASKMGKVPCQGTTSKSSVRHPPVLLPRFHPETRYEGFTFSCCTRCKGEVLIV